MPPVEEGRFSTEGSVHLDALRGAAALVVVLGHTRSLYFSSTSAQPSSTQPGSSSQAPTAVTSLQHLPPPPEEVKITLGNEAVMVFFVLSGFLVGGSVLKALERRRWSWTDYAAKRMTRLWVVLIPALLIGLAIDSAGLNIFAGHPDSIYAAPASQLIVYPGIASRLGVPVLLGNVMFTQGILVPNLGVNDSLWSLAFEFWYYLLFPLLAIAVLPGTKILSRLCCIVLAIATAKFVGTGILMLFPVWLLGAAVAALPLRFTEQTAKWLTLASSAVLIVSLPLVRGAPVRMYAAEWTIALIAAWLIYLVKHLTTQRKDDLYSAVAGFFSRISYTLYLVHLPMAVFLCACFNRPWHIQPKTAGNLAIWAATNVALIGAAYLIYLLFEARTDFVRSVVMRTLGRRRIQT